MASGGFPPIIDAQLNYLLTHSPLSIKVEQMWSGSKITGSLDRVTLLIPYCLDYVKWDVIYNACRPSAAPDVIFSPEDELFHPFSGARRGEADSPKNSLSEWNGRDPSQLLSLIHELREEYKAYQKKRVEEVDDNRVKFELSTIPSREGIEMHLNSGVEKPNEVKFAVPLVDLNLDKMVIGCSSKRPSWISLQVIFPVGKNLSPTCSAPRIKLMGSSELNDLFSLQEFMPPLWSDGMCMAEYLPILEIFLEEQILQAVSAIELKRQLIVALATLFGRPIEADPIFCRKATFLAASGIFTFLVYFVFTSQFPKQQPILMLQSSQHFDLEGAPLKSVPMGDYPWSPRWEPPHMAERILEFVGEECLKFKKFCNDVTVPQH